jgi:PAS domain S-box-containing protein
MPRNHPPGASSRIHWLALAVALLLFAGYVARNIQYDRLGVEARERARLLTQARVIEENLGPQLEGTVRALKGVDDELVSLPAGARNASEINRQLRVLKEAMPGVRTMLVIDANGVVRFSNREPMLGVDVGEREYFLRARQNPSPGGLILSLPFKTVLGSWAMVLSLPLSEKSGAFAGLAAATLDPEYFKTLLGSVDYAPDMRASVAHGAGPVYLTMPESAEVLGKDLAQPGSNFTRHLESGARESFFTGPVYSTGEDRMMAVITVNTASLPMDEPLVVAVSRDTDAVFAGWRADARGQAAIVCLVALLACAALAVYQRRQRVHARDLALSEAKLHESEQRALAITGSAQDAILMIDAAGKISFWNPAAERILGYSAREALGADLHELLMPPDYAAAFAAGYAGFRSSGTGPVIGKTIEVTARRKDGAVIPIGLSISALKQNGSWGAVGILRDISERKRAEAERLREGELRRAVLDNSSVGIFLGSLDRVILLANKRAREMFGYAAGEMEGQSFQLIHASAGAYRSVAELYPLLTQSGIAGTDYLYRRKDGSLFWCQITGTALDPDDLGKGVIWTFLDISERKRAEAALAAETTRLQTLLETASDGVHILDEDGKLVQCSQSFARMLGYSMEEATRLNLVDWEAAASRTDPREALNELFDRPATFETRHRRKDGTVFDVEINARGIELDGRHYLYASSRDISERKRAEGLIKASEARLQCLVNILRGPAASVQEVLDNALTEAIALTRSTIGYIYHYSEERQEFILHAWSRQVMEECTIIKPHTCYELKNTGLWGEAVRQRAPVVVNDFAAAHPLKKGYPAGHAPVRRFLTVPVIIAGKVVAVVGVANKDEDYDDTDTRHLDLLMDAVWKVIGRLRAEEQLNERANFVRFNPAPVLRVAKDGHILRLNPAAEAALGPSRVGTFVYDILPELAGLQPQDIDPDNPLRLECKLGDKWFALAVVASSLDDSFFVYGSDISLRKELEDRLIETNAALRQTTAWKEAILENSAVGILVASRDRRILDVNRRMAAMLDYAPDALLGRSPAMIHKTPKHFEEFRLKYYPLIEQNKIVDGEIQLKRQDGSLFWCEISGSPIDPDDLNKGVIWIVLDATQRRLAQESLRAVSLYTRSLIEANLDPMIASDPDGLIMDVNKAAEDAFGRTRSELIGQQFKQFDANPEATFAAFRAMMERGSITGFPAAIRHASGSLVELSLNATVLRDQNGKILGVLATGRDITKLKRIEEDLRRAKDGAEAASRAKGEFLANMSHEIRTPISGLLGMIELAKSAPAMDTCREWLELGAKAGRSLLRIINDILDYSQIEAGKLHLCLEAFSLQELTSEVTATISLLAREKGLELQVSIDPAVPVRLCGDQGRLAQILLNLLGNAVKYTDKGRVRLRIAPAGPRPGEGESAPGLELTFAVEDTGIGIPGDKLEALFTPFSQVDSSSSKRFQGTGLGLSICKRLVDMMDGRIWVDSEPGKGSVFTFTARLAEAPATPELPDQPAPPQAPDASAAAAGLDILLAEDDPINRRFILTMLKEAGHRVIYAANGVEALALAGKTRFDLILMDIQMPSMGGDEAARRIREREATTPGAPRTPILALTAYALPEDRERFLSQGIDECVTKPIDVDELFAAIARLSQARPRPAAPQPPEAAPAVASGFDQAALARRFAGRFDFWGELAGEFLGRSLPAHLARIRSALEQDDLEAAGKAAHTLKGVSGTVCAGLAEDLARQAVVAAQQGDAAGLRALLARLEEEEPRLEAALAVAMGGEQEKRESGENPLVRREDAS